MKPVTEFIGTFCGFTPSNLNALLDHCKDGISRISKNPTYYYVGKDCYIYTTTATKEQLASLGLEEITNIDGYWYYTKEL